MIKSRTKKTKSVKTKTFSLVDRKKWDKRSKVLDSYLSKLEYDYDADYTKIVNQLKNPKTTQTKKYYSDLYKTAQTIIDRLKKEKSDKSKIKTVHKADGLSVVNQSFKRKAVSGSGGTGLVRGNDVTSLNKFIDIGSLTFDVHTAQSVNPKTGKKFGKHLLFTDTSKEMHDVISRDCEDNTNYESGKACELDILNEDMPEFCLMGKTCIKKSVEKRIENKYMPTNNGSVEELSDEEFEKYMGIDFATFDLTNDDSDNQIDIFSESKNNKSVVITDDDDIF
jgi:hypothetical protein